MIQILEHQLLEVHNLLTFRGNIVSSGIDKIEKEMDSIIEAAGARRVGNTIKAVHAVIEDKTDIELLIPIDKEIDVTDTFTYKEVIKIYNAIVGKYIGNPDNADEALRELNTHIVNNHLYTTSVAYSVTKNIDRDNINNSETDIYIGISPNIL